MKTLTRFSKTNLVNALLDDIIILENVHKFDRNNGYAQVEGKKTSVIVAYGRYQTLLDLVEEIDQ